MWLDVQAPANGRIRKATITAFDDDGKVICTDKADLTELLEVQKAAKRLAPRLGVEPKQVEGILGERSAELYERHLEQQKRAVLPSPAPTTSEILDSAPEVIRRPLALIGRHGYASTWLTVGTTMPESTDPETGKVTPTHKEYSTRQVVVRDDGNLYTDGLGSTPSGPPAS